MTPLSPRITGRDIMVWISACAAPQKVATASLYLYPSNTYPSENCSGDGIVAARAVRATAVVSAREEVVEVMVFLCVIANYRMCKADV